MLVEQCDSAIVFPGADGVSHSSFGRINDSADLCDNNLNKILSHYSSFTHEGVFGLAVDKSELCAASIRNLASVIPKQRNTYAEGQAMVARTNRLHKDYSSFASHLL